MKALTVRQPWASLIACGAKTIETRSWSTSYRGPLAIHAGKQRFGFSSPTAEFIRSLPLDVWGRIPREHADAELCDNYPLGAVVAVAELVDVVPTGRIEWCDEPDFDGRDSWVIAKTPRTDVSVRHDQLPLGDFTPGRFAWLLGDVRALPEPVEATGWQRLWTLPADVASLVEAPR